MNRIYIENDNARITLRDDMLLDIEMYSGVKFESIEARRLFPITGKNKYITLLDTDKKEVAVILNVDTLMLESKKAVLAALNQYYLVPKIIKITEIVEKFGTIRVNALTDHGNCYFEVSDRARNLKVLYDGRVLIRDTNDNRYEIPDMKKLDRRSLDVFLL